jgi:hypothetical protein
MMKMKIVLKVVSAINFLTKNREDHIEEYAKQIDGWKLKMEEYTAACTEWAANGGVGDRPHMTQKPQNFTEDYDFFLNQLKHHMPDFITVDEHDFKQIVQNEFGWKNTFTANSNLYSNH